MSNCRICNTETKFIGSLGNLYLNDFPRQNPTTQLFPLDLVMCQACLCLQLNDDPPVMYQEEYWYRSSINPTIIDDLAEIASLCKGYPEGSIWVDIGANDGTLLSFVPTTFKRVAVEPAQNLFAELSGRCDAVIKGTWSYDAFAKVGDKAKVITAIAMLYDLPNPNAFMVDIKRALDYDGVFIAQLMTAAPMVATNDVGNICHEHIEYYSYQSLVKLFEQNGLEIFKVEINRMNGGSYRLFARHYKQPSIMLHEELSEEIYQNMFKQFEKNKADTVAFIHERRLAGKRVYGYGASTKGNTILQYYGVELDGVADRNHFKWKRHMLNGAPIVKEDTARRHADFFFILPWAFTDQFIARERDWYDEHHRFIVSTPKFKVI